MSYNLIQVVFLHPLGVVLHAVNKVLILRADRRSVAPRLNSLVIDTQGKRIGKVQDLFGPVEEPYVMVRPFKGVDTTLCIGKGLYVDDTSRGDGKWKR